MKKLTLLFLCLILCNCQLYINELNRQKGIIKRSPEEISRIEQIKNEDFENYNLVKNEKIIVGMSEEHLLLSWKKPKRINESCHSRVGCIKQYVYVDTYVYVKDGKVSSWSTH